jgi:tetratricopeptide (TPR) repeat protein
VDAYRAARATLAEEMGVELGPALRELHDKILHQDVSLAHTPATPTGTSWLPGERGIALSLALAEVYLVLGRFADAQSMLQDVIDAGDEAGAQAARLEHARIQFIIGPDPVPLSAIEEEATKAAAVFAGDDATVQRAEFLIGCVRMREGRMTESEAAFRDSLARAERVDHMRERIATRWMVGEVLASGPVPVADALAECERLPRGLPMEHPGLLMHQAVLSAMEGKSDVAEAVLERARDVIVEQLRAPRLLIFAHAAAATLALLQGDLDAAEQATRARLEIALRGVERESVAQSAGWLALILRQLGRQEEAAKHASRSAAIAPFGVPGRAISMAASGDARAAAALVPEEMPNLRADMLLCLAWDLRAAGDEAGAIEAEGEAARLYRSKGNVVSAEQLVPAAVAPT